MEQSNKKDFEIEEEVKDNFMEEFGQIIPKWGRKLLRDLGIVALPKWDIENSMIFYIVRKAKDTLFKTEEEV